MSQRKIIRVRDVMKTSFSTIDGNAAISEALRKMKAAGTSMLIVEKRHDDDEYGMLLVSDVARQVLARDKAPARVNVYEVMQKPVICVSPGMDIRYCSRLFTQHDLTRAPVIEDGIVIGTISPSLLVLDGLASLEPASG